MFRPAQPGDQVCAASALDDFIQLCGGHRSCGETDETLGKSKATAKESDVMAKEREIRYQGPMELICRSPKHGLLLQLQDYLLSGLVKDT